MVPDPLKGLEIHLNRFLYNLLRLNSWNLYKALAMTLGADREGIHVPVFKIRFL